VTRPAPSATTERLYAALPELYQAADAELGDGDNGYPLLRFLSLLGDQLDDVEMLIARADYYSPDDGGAPGDTSDLADPATADPAWLPWLAQLVGARLPAGLTDAERRAAVAGAVAGYFKGTKQGIEAAARAALTGTKYVRVIPLYAGDQWRLEVRTRTSETASTAAVAAAIVAANAKPAGVELVATAYEATWAQVEAAYPTWAALEANAPTWLAVEETGAP
jgi:hypothetical protein